MFDTCRSLSYIRIGGCEIEVFNLWNKLYLLVHAPIIPTFQISKLTIFLTQWWLLELDLTHFDLGFIYDVLVLWMPGGSVLHTLEDLTTIHNSLSLICPNLETFLSFTFGCLPLRVSPSSLSDLPSSPYSWTASCQCFLLSWPLLLNWLRMLIWDRERFFC